jgi:hypothetical protein
LEVGADIKGENEFIEKLNRMVTKAGMTSD